MIKYLFEKIPKSWIAEIKYFFSNAEKIELLHNRKVYIFLAADYGNLGDIALTFAQLKLISEYFPNHVPIEVPSSISISQLKGYIQSVSENDIVTIIAGGNMGDVWSWFEIYRQLIVRKLKNKKIYQFPQTTTYTNSTLGRNLLASAIKIYKGHNLKMMAREKMSFEFMRRKFNCSCFLAPDLVMTLNYWGNRNRKGILLCLRNDREKFLSSSVKKKIMSVLSDTNKSINIADTKIEGDFDYKKRYNILDDFIKEVSKSEVIVTDRLHGMIFAYITGTPAVVLPNSNRKIEMCYEWISNCGFIHFLPLISKQSFGMSLNMALNDRVDVSVLSDNSVYFKSIFNNIFENEK